MTTTNLPRHCRHGHLVAGANVLVHRRGPKHPRPSLECRQCHARQVRASQARRTERKRAARAAARAARAREQRRTDRWLDEVAVERAMAGADPGRELTLAELTECVRIGLARSLDVDAIVRLVHVPGARVAELAAKHVDPSMVQRRLQRRHLRRELTAAEVAEVARQERKAARATAQRAEVAPGDRRTESTELGGVA